MADPGPASFGDYYREIYMRGLGGEQPSIPVDSAELERRAEEAMEPRTAGYVYAAAGSGETMRANRDAFRRRRIVPRMLRDVADRDLSTRVLETEMPAPVLLAPIGAQTIVHPQGELASSRAAAALGLPFVASSAAAHTLEEIAEAGGPRWFQLYWPNDPKLAESLVSRAEAAGYEAIVVTVDTFIPGWKPRDLQQAWLPFLEGVGNANYLQDPVFRAALDKPPEEDLGAATGHYLGVYVNPSLTWDDLAWLEQRTSLPILIKGILHPDDAREAQVRGAAGVIVSNHGGRQVDGAIASLDALEPVVAAVGGELAVLLDSGIRSGADIFKALALGADAVLVGRPYLWGLALEGQAGVETVLKMLLAELDLTMALSGHTRPSRLDQTALADG
jgi:isopentenyl diphosphate isomerase/L-lactate dehydrogenase-like FMN-dependent dehydrogenase